MMGEFVVLGLVFFAVVSWGYFIWWSFFDNPMFDNLGSGVTYIDDEAEFHQACFNGMRRGIQ